MQCLESVFEQTRVSFELFVVDNASSDGSAQMVAQQFPEVHLIANDTNNGFAAANNQAIPLAQGTYVLLLNPDTRVLDHALDKMVNYLEESRDAGALACKLLNSDGSLQKSVGNFYSFCNTLLENRIIPKLAPSNDFLAKKLVAFWDHNSEREIDWARGAVLMVRRAVVEQIGLLDEQFYIYGEEIDWCWRIKAAGWKIMYIPESEIIHHGKAASNQRQVEMFIQNYKSFYIFLKKHYPLYSYRLYRARTLVYTMLWLTRLSLQWIAAIGNVQKQANAKNGLALYLASLKWHFSADSKIKVHKKVNTEMFVNADV